MSGIRVNTGAVKIEVNDDGEYIMLNFGDHDFLNGFYDLQAKVQSMAKDMGGEEAAIREKHKDDPMEQGRAVANLSAQFHKQIMVEIDSVFGPETCRKVFGDIVPWFELYLDFFDQLTPYFEKYVRDRAARMDKYRPDRTGNV